MVWRSRYRACPFINSANTKVKSSSLLALCSICFLYIAYTSYWRSRSFLATLFRLIPSWQSIELITRLFHLLLWRIWESFRPIAFIKISSLFLLSQIFSIYWVRSNNTTSSRISKVLTNILISSFNSFSKHTHISSSVGTISRAYLLS